MIPAQFDYVRAGSVDEAVAATPWSGAKLRRVAVVTISETSAGSSPPSTVAVPASVTTPGWARSPAARVDELQVTGTSKVCSEAPTRAGTVSGRAATTPSTALPTATVSDTGSGIADPEAVFLPRDRGDDPAAVHGLGIGLPLSREFARRRGGEVWVVDPGGDGRGAVVAARLPGVIREDPA